MMQSTMPILITCVLAIVTFRCNRLLITLTLTTVVGTVDDGAVAQLYGSDTLSRDYQRDIDQHHPDHRTVLSSTLAPFPKNTKVEDLALVSFSLDHFHILKK